MLPLIVLIVVFLITLFVTRLTRKKYDVAFSGRMAMSVMLLLTATGHFLYPEGMAMMLPGFIPFKEQVIFLTGLLEIAFAIGLQILNIQKLTAWLLIIFFILILPSNIYAAINNVDYQKATFEGHGLNYLWFRIPLQIIFIIWTWFFCIRTKNN